ncbi:MAG: outer membrane beta-barrel domain-containing protein [Myxococcota bacterium]
MRRPIALAITSATVLLLMVTLVAEEQQAYAQQRRASLDEGPIVRRKLLFRSSRFEIMPQIGMTLNDSYKRNALVGLEANFYLTNEFGLGISGLFSPLQLNTSLFDQIDSSADPEVRDQLSYAVVTALFDAHVNYVPIFGKFTLFGTIIDYDIHLLGGFGGALIGSDGPRADDAEYTGFQPAPVIGGGGRLFVRDSFALTLDVKDYIYSTADTQIGTTRPETELRDNFVISLGFSIFLPGDVPISR